MVKQLKLRALLCGAALLCVSVLSAQTRKIDIWDFGGVETGGAVYRNNITGADLESLGDMQGGKFIAEAQKTRSIEFGDLVLGVINNDRLYYNKADGSQGKNSAGQQGYMSFDFNDGYVSNGIYYCNGSGGEGRRYIIINNVKAGDKITFYGRTSNSAEASVHFVHLGADGAASGRQSESAKLEAVSAKYEYAAAHDGSYKIYSGTESGKPVYYRVVRTPGIAVVGALSVAAGASNFRIRFVNQTTNAETDAVISGKSYTAVLAPGYTYTAVLSGAKGYGVSGSTKTIEVPDSAFASGKINAPLSVVEQKIYAASGNIAGFAADYDISKLSVDFVPPSGTTAQPVSAEIKDGASYSAVLEPNVAYSVILGGVNDYQTPADFVFNETEDTVKDIPAEKKPLQNVSGTFAGLEKGALPSGITFINIEDEYRYQGVINGNGYTASLRRGAYTVRLDLSGYETKTHIVVNDAAVSKNIKVNKTAAAEKVKYAKKLYVGGKKGKFKTVSEALAAADAMEIASEKQRVTVYIAPGVYREQIRVRSPYITLANTDPSKEVKLTWYYGIGYKYFSAGTDGFYDEDCAFDLYEKRTVSRWGAAAQILPAAVGFRAENITFETSFGKYITDEEIADGVESDGSMPFVRKLTSDPASRAATERSAAMASEADLAEFKNCRFIGTQDTLYIGKNTRQYYRNCYIEGNTDFIFGDVDTDIVFDSCEIAWCGYSDTASGGYIAVSKDCASKGYLFIDCFVSSKDGMKHAPGYFGRPWGQNARIAFVGTKLDRADSIAPQGWTSMSGNVPEKAAYKEIGTTYNAAPVDTAQRVSGTIAASAEEFSKESYFGEWKPMFYEPSLQRAPSFSKRPSLTSNDDINLPYAGHVLTLHYELDKQAAPFDTSLIRWYRVGKDGTETPVKTESGVSSDRTYTISSADAGCIIKVIVDSEISGGYKGESLAASTEATVREGTAVASKGKAVSRAENKINIFLAGDSTVKDYSAAGMYNGGVARNEGAWGEYLQDFFAKDAVAVHNYANGGRSTRNFINEGTLEKIAAEIKAGDYLFIQFGHNDSSNGAGYLDDRYVPLGKPNKAGVYPVQAGKKVPTPSSFADKYGSEFYSYDCGGTQKWYLMQYIDAARKAGAIPVLVTPVARQYFDGNGKIRPHHDSTDTKTGTLTTSGNAYVEVVRQLAEEQHVALIDGFELTCALYEESYAAGKKYPGLLMAAGDSTHNNKLGGFIIAGLIAQKIKTAGWSVSPYAEKPSRVLGENNDGQYVFTVGADSTFSAFKAGLDGKYSIASDYWTDYGQKLINRF
ncbi:MAG: pectinesterase family protein [Bacteroides sp.]|nr:pectinesterase family protein [Prevotella sp.]MCM1408246.1 pectinesterase family protein [Treponema brennaborense]MCM1469570.1 pectinesterase family protein [Bacteroides sp.]